MSISNKISKLVGNYGTLSFPVLGVLEIKSQNTFLVNKSFEDVFLLQHHSDSHQEIIKNHIDRLKDVSQIHHRGNIYMVDEFDVVNGVRYYFYSLSNQSVHQSFLWLKHDLLNILNPIMGFSDVLEESEEIPTEDQILIKKIKSNSDKLYQQIQKLALLQSLEYKSNESEGSYEIDDFINELANQLIANNIFTNISKTEIAHLGKVSDRITYPDFRSTLEEHLEYLSNYQNEKEIKILSVYYNHSFRIKIFLPDCKPPIGYNETLTDIEKFLSHCTPIEKLQISALNYLIINEICDTFGASIKQRSDNNNIIIEINMPSLSNESEIKKLQAGSMVAAGVTFNEFSANDLPIEIANKMSLLCNEFDGLLILDEWQTISDKLRNINLAYKNETLGNIIHDIENGIQTFDVEKLRNIYEHCYKLFHK